MFNLDQSIAEWRRQIMAAGVKNPNVLDELDSHLREDVQRQIELGASPEEAFKAALGRIGAADALKKEFSKACRASDGRRKGVAALLVGVILFFSFETIFHTPIGLGQQLEACLAVIGMLVIVCSWRYVAPHVFPAFAKQRLKAIGGRCGFYLKAAFFLLPAALVWVFSCIVVMPKLQETCRAAGFGAFNLINLTRLGEVPVVFKAWAEIGGALVFLTNHGLLIGCAVVLAFAVLEWRSTGWQRYRRATVGAGIFVFNFAVLLSLTFMVMSSVVASSFLMHHVK